MSEKYEKLPIINWFEKGRMILLLWGGYNMHIAGQQLAQWSGIPAMEFLNITIAFGVILLLPLKPKMLLRAKGWKQKLWTLGGFYHLHRRHRIVPAPQQRRQMAHY